MRVVAIRFGYGHLGKILADSHGTVLPDGVAWQDFTGFKRFVARIKLFARNHVSGVGSGEGELGIRQAPATIKIYLRTVLRKGQPPARDGFTGQRIGKGFRAHIGGHFLSAQHHRVPGFHVSRHLGAAACARSVKVVHVVHLGVRVSAYAARVGIGEDVLLPVVRVIRGLRHIRTTNLGNAVADCFFCLVFCIRPNLFRSYIVRIFQVVNVALHCAVFAFGADLTCRRRT